MLVLQRNIKQSIKIGDDITVTILNVNGSQVSVGISAPREIGVHREEVYDRIQRGEKQEDKDTDYMY